ncbi:hypothetical protein [Desulfosarcina cetonica]|uniref:hypothetical protein n=1 Tax=Desulfosarcina cetonica TaxID=90730 RepID=UPI0006D122F3|nr:hypothetical protein [Desulfosarcina cetonica]
MASLLIDPYVGLDAALQKRLLAYATDLAVKSLGCDPVRFIRGYHCCRVTRNLQMLGAFGHLTRVKNKPAFATWIPMAADMLGRHLKRIEDLELPGVYAIARQIADLRS